MKILRNRVGFDDVYCNGLEICKSQGDYDHAAVGCLGNLDRPAAPTVMMQPLLVASYLHQRQKCFYFVGWFPGFYLFLQS